MMALFGFQRNFFLASRDYRSQNILLTLLAKTELKRKMDQNCNRFQHDETEHSVSYTLFGR